MLAHLATYALGLVALAAGTALLARAASRLAIAGGAPARLVELVVVPLAAAAPQVATTIVAAMRGRTDVALGAAVGAGAFGMLFAVGACALLAPMPGAGRTVRRWAAFALAAPLALAAAAWNGVVGFLDGAAFVAALAACVATVVASARREAAGAPDGSGRVAAGGRAANRASEVAAAAAGVVLLAFGAHRLTGAAVRFAQATGAPELVIGLAPIAAAAVLPTLAVAIVAASGSRRDVAMGAVMAGCAVGFFGGVGVAALASSAGLPVAPSLRAVDLWVIAAAALVTIPLVAHRGAGRRTGAVLVACYLAYAAWRVTSGA